MHPRIGQLRGGYPAEDENRQRWKATLSVLVTIAAAGTLLTGAIGLAGAAGPSNSMSRRGLIAFIRTGTHPDDDLGDIYVMSSDGSGQRNVTRDPAFYSDLAWSPDGGRIVFAAQKRVKLGRDVWATNVYVMNADGGGLRPLTRTAWSDHPVWSPDSRRIAFLRHGTKPPGNDGGSTVSDIYVVNVDGKGLRRLTHSPSEEYALAWSTRNRIAFVRDSLKGQMPKGEIFTMRPDGSGERRLTHTRDGESGLAWSPTGHRLLFVRWLNSRDLPSIFVMDADGTNQRRLLESSRAYDYYNWPDIGAPAWSPDGSRITFIGGSAAAKGANQVIFVMRASGAGLHKVGGNDTQAPSWAPDSRTIAFVQHPAIYLVNASGIGQHRLIPRPGRPAFSLHENWTPIWTKRARR